MIFFSYTLQRLGTMRIPDVQKKNLYFIVIAVFIYGIILLLTAAIQNFYQFHNDFWDVFFIARTMNAHVKATWFNPQYPIGSTLFLKLIVGKGSPVIPAIISNILFGVGIIFFSGLLYSHFFIRKSIVFLMMGLLALYPTLFHYLTLGGGDPGLVLFFTAGSFLITYALYEKKDHPALFIAGGILMGTGALFRYHGLPGSVLFLIAFVPFYKQSWKQLLLASICIGIAYLPQITINLLTGHGLLETQFGPMNVYDLMYDISWYETITLHIPSSIFPIILKDPALFMQKYGKAFLSFFPGYFPAIIASIMVSDTRKKHIAAAASVFGILYFGLFSATTSGRQILMVLPISILCAGFIIEELATRVADMRYAQNLFLSKGVIFAAGLLLFLLSVYKDIKKVQIRKFEAKQYSSMEKVLQSEGCTSVRQIFSTNFDFYVPSLYPYITFFNGGAPRWGTFGFNEEYPEFPVKHIEDFVAFCKNKGVRFLVLTHDCHLLSPMLFAMYNQSIGQNLYTVVYTDQKQKLFILN